MLFNSIEFLVYFPIVILIYFLLPQRFRWLHLLLASCFFYASFVPIYLLILAFTIVIDYIAGILIEEAQGKRKRIYLLLSIIANCGVLAIFKYYNFLTENINVLLGTVFSTTNQLPYLNIILPIGLSFHTFQAMSYTIEVFRENQKAERHFGIYSLYVMYFPQLVAGPIERPQNLLDQFKQKHDFDYTRIRDGLFLMLWGMFQKVVIADRLALYVNPVFENVNDFYGVSIWIATLFFAFQIYCDFAGYTDIARGASRVMGIELMVNFRQPYLSSTVTEFWSRWHISLSTWFRDYLYIPLGGNRLKEKWKVYRNLAIVFTVSGLWHGANWTYVVWGSLHAVYIILEKYFEKQYKSINFIIRYGITFFLVLLAWIFFRAETIQDAFNLIERSAVFYNTNSFKIGFYKEGVYDISKFSILISFVWIGFLMIVNYLQNRYQNWNEILWKSPAIVRWGLYYFLIISILELGVFSENQFIYFQF
jgi:alginate O-acetyltransferase complex protein AlgI